MVIFSFIRVCGRNVMTSKMWIFCANCFLSFNVPRNQDCFFCLVRSLKELMGRHSCLTAFLGSVLNVIQPQCISDQFFHLMIILSCRCSRKSQVLEDEYLSVCVNWHIDFKEKQSTFNIDISPICASSCDLSQTSNAKNSWTVQVSLY